MLGLAVHRSVLAAGDPETGVTIHEVTADLDAGPILAQARVPVLAGDDPETLAARVLAEEHRLLVATLTRHRRSAAADQAPKGSAGMMRASMADGVRAASDTTQERPGS